jgi:NAD(P)-dependent dehydrogenase (short-subunit alcohol dehydrogenase family)
LACALAEAGARVAVCSRTAADLEQLVEEIQARGGDAFPFVLDVSDFARTEQIVEEIAERFGRLDILVNSAGITLVKDTLDVTTEEWDRIHDVNLKGPFVACQAAGRIMLKQGYGRIVNITSIGAHVGFERAVAYAASKGGLSQVTMALALEWVATGITVNSVAPGFVASSLTAERMKDEEYMAFINSRMPMKRPGTPDDVVPAVLFLVSPAAGYVTGSTVFVDGGWTAQ